MIGLLIILLVWFLAGALVAVTIIWPACVIVGSVSQKEEDYE